MKSFAEDIPSPKLLTIYSIISAQYIKKKYLDEEKKRKRCSIIPFARDQFKEEFSNAIFIDYSSINKRWGIFQYSSITEEWEINPLLLNPLSFLNEIRDEKKIKNGEIIPIDSINKEILDYAKFFKRNFESIILPLYLKSPDIISLNHEIDLCYLVICHTPYATSFYDFEIRFGYLMNYWEDYIDYSKTDMCKRVLAYGLRYIFQSPYLLKRDSLIRRIIREASNTRKSFEKEVLPLYLKNSQKIVRALKNK